MNDIIFVAETHFIPVLHHIIPIFYELGNEPFGFWMKIYDWCLPTYTYAHLLDLINVTKQSQNIIHKEFLKWSSSSCDPSSIYIPSNFRTHTQNLSNRHLHSPYQISTPSFVLIAIIVKCVPTLNIAIFVS